MKILHVHSLHGHSPWMQAVLDLSGSVDAITVAGDCLPIATYRKMADEEQDLKRWIAALQSDVYFSRGGCDCDMSTWGYQHLHLSGTHETKHGWAIHVLDSISIEREMPRKTSLQEIVVSHYAPAGTECGVDMPSRANYGRGDVRAILQELGDVRLILTGRVWQPQSRLDIAEGVACCCPGLSRQEHGHQPAHARIATESRHIELFDGNKKEAFSFVR